MRLIMLVYTMALVAVLMCLSKSAFAQNSPCYWSGTVVKCFPTTGIFLNGQRSLRLGDSTTNYVELKASSSVTTHTLTLPIAQGAANSFLSNNGSGVLSWSAGTTYNPMDSAGDMIYGGTAGVATKLDNGATGQWLVAAGAAAPTWTDTTTTAKTVQATSTGGSTSTLAIDQVDSTYAGRMVALTSNRTASNSYAFFGAKANGSDVFAIGGGGATSITGLADGIELTVKGNGTQTNNIFVVKKSDDTIFMNVPNSGVVAFPTGISAPTSALGNVFSGNYTPSCATGCSLNTNLTAAAYDPFQYSRVGNVVTVSGTATLDPNLAATTTIAGLSLPVASNFTAANDCAGTAVGKQGAAVFVGGIIYAGPTDDQCFVEFISGTDTAVRTWTFSFSYTVK